MMKLPTNTSFGSRVRRWRAECGPLAIQPFLDRQREPQRHAGIPFDVRDDTEPYAMNRAIGAQVGRREAERAEL